MVMLGIRGLIQQPGLNRVVKSGPRFSQIGTKDVKQDPQTVMMNKMETLEWLLMEHAQNVLNNQKWITARFAQIEEVLAALKKQVTSDHKSLHDRIYRLRCHPYAY
jgi:hypothetical protein